MILFYEKFEIVFKELLEHFDRKFEKIFRVEKIFVEFQENFKGN